MPFLGAIPLTPRIRDLGDAGAPLVAANPEHPVSEQFREIADAIKQRIGAAA